MNARTAAPKPAAKPADKAADKPADKPAATPAVTPDNKPKETTVFDFSAVPAVAAAALPKQVKETKANPLVPTVKISVDNDFKPFSYGPVPAAMVSKAKNLMHRAARELGVGLAVRVATNADGSGTITYQAKAEKKTKQYTSADVRAWIGEQIASGSKDFAGYDAKKRLSPEFLSAFRTAKGFDKAADKPDDKPADVKPADK